MPKTKANVMAKKYIDRQKRILKKYGDSPKRSKVKAAIASAEKTFESLLAAGTGKAL